MGITLPGRLFVDMDGVLADFDSGYESAFGVRPSIAADNVDWTLVRARKNFYLDLPPMPDFPELWAFIQPLNPIIITGIPHSVEEASFNKIQWVEKNLGRDIPVVTCLSRYKSLHCQTGDILIDDWDKYKQLWINAGGIWITHVSASKTIGILSKVGQ